MGSPGGLPVPKKVALDWRSWGIHPEGVLKGNAERREKFRSITIPIKFIGLSDDHLLAPWNAVKALASFYSG